MPPDFSVAFDGLEPPDVVRATARDAEAAGARSLWFAAHLFNREPIATAACALAATSRIKVALMALSPYTVHPVYAAMAAATLDEWFPGVSAHASASVRRATWKRPVWRHRTGAHAAREPGDRP